MGFSAYLSKYDTVCWAGSLAKWRELLIVTKDGSNMNKKQFTVHMTPDPVSGYVGGCLELPAAMSQAETREQLLENMKEAIQLVLETIDDAYKESEKIVEIPSRAHKTFLGKILANSCLISERKSNRSNKPYDFYCKSMITLCVTLSITKIRGVAHVKFINKVIW